MNSKESNQVFIKFGKKIVGLHTVFSLKSGLFVKCKLTRTQSEILTGKKFNVFASFIKREKLCNFDYKVRTMTVIRRVTDS